MSVKLGAARPSIQARRDFLQNIAVFLFAFGVSLQSVPAIGGISWFEILILLATLLILPTLVASDGRIPYRRSPINVWFLYTTGAFFLSGIATDPTHYLPTILFSQFSVFLAMFTTRSGSRSASCAALFAGLVLALTAIGQSYGAVPVFSFSRVSNYRDSVLSGYTGLVPSRGSFGILLMTSLMFALIQLFETRRFSLRLLWLGYVATVGAATALSLSRSTVVAYLTVLISFFILQLSVKRLHWNGGAARLRIGYFVAVGLAIISVWMFASGILGEVVDRLIAIREGSVRLRFEGILTGLDAIPGHLVFGIGSEVAETRVSIHNAYVAVLVERGIFGFAGFVFLNITVLIVLLRHVLSALPSQHHKYSALLASFLGVQAELAFFRGYMSVSYWVFLAILLIFLGESSQALRQRTTVQGRNVLHRREKT